MTTGERIQEAFRAHYGDYINDPNLSNVEKQMIGAELSNMLAEIQLAEDPRFENICGMWIFRPSGEEGLAAEQVMKEFKRIMSSPTKATWTK